MEAQEHFPPKCCKHQRGCAQFFKGRVRRCRKDIPGQPPTEVACELGHMDGRTRGRGIPGRENRKGKGQRVWRVQGLLPLLGGREWECEVTVLSSFTVIKASVVKYSGVVQACCYTISGLKSVVAEFKHCQRLQIRERTAPSHAARSPLHNCFSREVELLRAGIINPSSQ